jgi:hypothetical protein
MVSVGTGTGRWTGAGKETRGVNAQGHRVRDSVGFREGKGYPSFRSVSFDR